MNQKNTDYQLGIFKDLPIRHKCIIAQPLIGAVEPEKYLDGVELVAWANRTGMPDYPWMLDIRE